MIITAFLAEFPFALGLRMALLGALAVMGMMFVLWLIHLKTGNAAIVDFGWSLGLAVFALLYAWLGPGYYLRKWLLAALVTFWGIRLALHLLFDRVIGKPEEGRYQALRREWGGNIKLKFLMFFEFQAVLDVFLSLPFLLACLNPTPEISLLEYTGLGVGVLSIAGEAVADAQLKRFKSDPASKGKTCRVGLWNYSRHPNYFFEWLIWMAYFLYALSSPYGVVSILCPLLMLYFLFRVTGIPATEAQALRSRGDDYRNYQQTTSAFVPWFKKKLKASAA